MRAAKALTKLRPGAEFTIDGADILWENNPAINQLYPKNVVWYTQTKQITKEEYDAILPEVIDEELKPYQFERMNAYPPMTELADALYWQSKGDETKMQKYLAEVEAVKTAFPKG